MARKITVENSKVRTLRVSPEVHRQLTDAWRKAQTDAGQLFSLQTFTERLIQDSLTAKVKQDDITG